MSLSLPGHTEPPTHKATDGHGVLQKCLSGVAPINRKNTHHQNPAKTDIEVWLSQVDYRSCSGPALHVRRNYK